MPEKNLLKVFIRFGAEYSIKFQPDGLCILNRFSDTEHACAYSTVRATHEVRKLIWNFASGPSFVAVYRCDMSRRLRNDAVTGKRLVL